MRLRYLFLLFVLPGCFLNSHQFRTETFRVTISGEGVVVRIQDWRDGTDYISRPSPLMQIRRDGEFLQPVLAGSHDLGLILTFEDESTALIGIEENESHLVLELLDISDPELVELAVWGPFATRIDKTIGETVGVVRGEEFAIGIQSLNPKTLGGFPWNENDAMPQIDLLEGDEYHDLDAAKSRYVLFRVEAAKPDSMGSSLQAFTRNRAHDRVVENRGYERYVAPAFDDGGVEGSKIALFGVPTDAALETIGKIEIEEDLPHPMIDGEWGKTSRSANAAYVIMNFSEEEAEWALDVTEKAGLRYLYHEGPFNTWGRFELNPESFPDGAESLRRISDMASERGLMVGLHTLSNFVTTDDAYVTPVPDERLAIVGSTEITSDLAATDTEISVQDPGYFNQSQKSYLAAARIGDEIITFNSVSNAEPWLLKGVERGAFGTRASAHAAGSLISKLDDHGYRVFLTNTALSIEMAQNLASLFNDAGLRQISFDGLEGNRSTGMGNYGEILFTKAWYDAINEDIRGHYIADASRTSHYFWHMYTRMNWGEPWYAGFRESQTEYRLKNQDYFQRNMMPGMLGWFKMTPETSLEDIEWMLSLSAGFDAGYGFVTSREAIEGNGRAGEILSLLSRWETARMADVFSEDQKERLKSRDQEFHLDELPSGGWSLTPVSVHVFRRFNKDRQPGEPEHSLFEFESSQGEGQAAFILTAEGGALSNITFSLDNNPPVSTSIRLDAGYSIVYRGGSSVKVFSPSWQEIQTLPFDASSVTLSAGQHEISFQSDQDGDAEAAVKLEIRIADESEEIPPSRNSGAM